MAIPTAIRLGTRGSLLARTQSQMVADALMKQHPGLKVELVLCKTTGDQVQDRPLHELGGKGLFTKELEEALLGGKVDFAVHSFKDVPVTMPLVDTSGLLIAAVSKREDPSDVLACRRAKSIADLPQGARVGTGSLRRRCQLLVLRPDVKVELIRGNIDTRVRKMRDGEFEAVILALAGLKRGGLFAPAEMTPIPFDQMLPAAAQGALAIQCRREDPDTRTLISVLDDPATHRAVDLERALVQELNGDCHSPIAALAEIDGSTFSLRAAVGARGGELPVIRAEARATSPEQTLQLVMQSLQKQNVREILGT